MSSTGGATAKADADAKSVQPIMALIGRLFYVNGVGTAIGLLLYGTHYAHANKARQRSLKSGAPRLWLLGALLFLFVSTTVRCFLDTFSFFNQIYTYLVDNSSPLRLRGNLFVQRYMAVVVLANFSTPINYILSDYILVWRTWVLCRDNRVLLVILAFLALADTVLGITYLTVTALSTLEVLNFSTEGARLAALSSPLLVTFSFISLTTNVLGTTCIGLKAWKHYNTSKAVASRGAVLNILIVLIETGAFMAAIQLIAAILSILSSYGDKTFTSSEFIAIVFYEIALFTAAILPTATVIIVWSFNSLEVVIGVSDAEVNTRAVSQLSTLRFGENPRNVGRSGGQSLGYNSTTRSGTTRQG
ncbi:hypothetical protein BDZ94DRAFT_1309605 [Collybia nuda]|uniref:Uncharacterized protein n=1 Tax=Collybia nuda TaxID=64659 RepID=A0A9P5Y745_9AGAR|nr:hypothetical protein BDZ94DRAFT_1309605 [Collybia nuda]